MPKSANIFSFFECQITNKQAPTHTPIYLRKGGDKFILITFASMLAVGIAGSVYGATKMARVSASFITPLLSEICAYLVFVPCSYGSFLSSLPLSKIGCQELNHDDRQSPTR